ncbi:MAG: DUF1295 domain-containing protein [Phenylobacterium sp.]
MLISLGLVLAFMTAVMLAAWAYGLRVRNGGWTDVFWTFGSGAALAGAALLHDLPSSPRQWLVAGLVALWSIRLGSYLAVRVAGHPEDPRYARFREDFGADYRRRMLGVTLAQAPATALLAVSVLVAAGRPEPGLDLRDAAGVALLVIALAGEALADAQMKRFRADPANKGKIAETGLWAWSRHPNYFFEWLAWLAYPALAFDPARPITWLSLTAPLVMYLLLTRVSGIPPLEASMLRSRGEAFRSYQLRVSSFFPLPPKRPRP